MNLNEIYLKYNKRDFSLGIKNFNEILTNNYWFCLFLYNKNELSEKDIVNMFQNNKKIFFVDKDNFEEVLGYRNQNNFSRDNQKIFIVEESLTNNISFKTLSLMDFKGKIRKNTVHIIKDRYTSLNDIDLNFKKDLLFEEITESKVNYIFAESLDEPYHYNLFIDLLTNKIKNGKKCCFVSDENSTYVYAIYNKIIASACNIDYERLIREKITEEESILIENFKNSYAENIHALKINNYEKNKQILDYDYVFSLGDQNLPFNNKSIYYILKSGTESNEETKTYLLNKYSKEIKKTNFLLGADAKDKISFLNFINLNKSPIANSFLLKDKLFFKNKEKHIIKDIAGKKVQKNSIY